MWIVYAFLSAIFAGITSILAKCGVKDTDSNVATAIRTIIVLIFAWIMVFIVGSQNTLKLIDRKSLVFLILSGLATGASWLCYFKALQIGDVNKVTPIDKSSTILTMLLAFIILGEDLTLVRVICMILIGLGTYLMIEKKKESKSVESNKYLLFAFGSAIFASLTSILGKIGIENIESNLGTAIRTIVVLFMAWIVVFATKKQNEVKNISKKSLGFLCISGITTGVSWMCYYRALQEGQAAIVVPIDKLSILVTIFFSYFILKEKLSKKSITGLAMIVLGTLLLLY